MEDWKTVWVVPAAPLLDNNTRVDYARLRVAMRWCRRFGGGVLIVGDGWNGEDNRRRKEICDRAGVPCVVISNGGGEHANTGGDVAVTIRMIQRRTPTARVVLVTSWYHTPRFSVHLWRGGVRVLPLLVVHDVWRDAWRVWGEARGTWHAVVGASQQSFGRAATAGKVDVVR